jgi:plastocyanin
MKGPAGGLCLVGLACATLGMPTRQPHQVRISQFRFAPAELTVSVGDSVVWTNDDALLHTTSADSGAWSSPEMRRGERYVLVAGRTGRFSYHCSAHPVMRGTLVVR